MILIQGIYFKKKLVLGSKKGAMAIL